MVRVAQVEVLRERGVLPRKERFGSPRTVDRAFDAEARLYAELERVARLYASRRPLGAEDRASVQAFSRDFLALAQPGHLAAYRALSPGFWTWLDANAR